MEEDETKNINTNDRVLYCFATDIKHNTFESKTRKFHENQPKRTILLEFVYECVFSYQQLLNLRLTFEGVEIMSISFPNQENLVKKDGEKKDNRLKIELPQVTKIGDNCVVMLFDESNMILSFYTQETFVSKIVVECDLMRMSSILYTSKVRLEEPDLVHITKSNINKRTKRTTTHVKKKSGPN